MFETEGVGRGNKEDWCRNVDEEVRIVELRPYVSYWDDKKWKDIVVMAAQHRKYKFCHLIVADHT